MIMALDRMIYSIVASFRNGFQVVRLTPYDEFGQCTESKLWNLKRL